MKPSHLLNLILAVALVIVSVRLVTTGGTAQVTPAATTSQHADSTALGDLQPIDVMKDLNGSPFGFIDHHHPALLMAGDSTASNAMTIGWGATGQVWGSDRPTITVYVAPGRYTHRFMERSKYFTVMKIDDRVLAYMGTHSGRDGDKGRALGLHVAYTPHGAPYYREATEVYECQLIYGAPFDPKGIREEERRKIYAHFEPGIHTIYMGLVVGAWKRQ